jgi:hypothetical protein
VKTTLTLDDDVAAKLQAEALKSGQSLDEAVNQFLRYFLSVYQELRTAKPFIVRARPLRLKQGLSYDNISELLEEVEGSLHQ